MKLNLPFGLFVSAAAVAAALFPLGNDLRRLQISDDETILVPESRKLRLKKQGINFVDITNFPNIFGSNIEDVEVPVYKYPLNVSNQKQVKSIIANIDTQAMYDDLSQFTSFYTRYYKSDTGYESAQWLSSKLYNATQPISGNVTITHVDHHSWKQFSIIVSIPGSTTPENIVVIGSHQDSINLILPSILPAPGADDNGSGTITNIEALRLYVQYLVDTNHWPSNTIEFHFYSAEEGGLLGSLDVFTQYARDSKKVVAMIQQDMTGYVSDPKNEHIGVVTDYTTEGLTKFVELIIDSYLDIPFVETECGYACSDHDSSRRNGFPSAFVMESDFGSTNKYIHSTMDTLDRLSFDHMAEHVKLAVGSIVELGTWDASLL